MKITDVRVKLVNNPADRLKAYCTVTLDDVFVVRDVKVVEGTSGLFIAMPSRKLSVPCGACGHKNHLRARFCNECGAKQPVRDLPPDDAEGRSRLHRDIAHPITTEFRHLLQDTVVKACLAEQERADQPDYKPVDLDEGQEEQAEPVQKKDEPEEESNEEAPSLGGVTEYDALIRDLAPGDDTDRRDSRGGRTRRRGGRNATSSGGGHADGSRGRGRRSTTKEEPRAERDTRGGGRGGKRTSRKRTETRKDQPSEEKRPPAPPRSTAPKPEPEVAVEPQADEVDLSGFGMGILDEVTVPNDKIEHEKKSTAKAKKASKPKAKPAPKPVEDNVPIEQAETPAPTVEEEEDSTAFGAGIL